MLMVKKKNGSWPGHWSFPGGKVESDGPDGVESFEAAAARELREETGLKVAGAGTGMGFVEFESPRQRYLATFHRWFDWSGTPRNLEKDKHTAVDWVPIGDWPLMLTPIARAFSGRIMSTLTKVGEARIITETLTGQHECHMIVRGGNVVEMSSGVEYETEIRSNGAPSFGVTLHEAALEGVKSVRIEGRLAR